MLVRRGYGDPEAARASSSRRASPHDPLLLGDMAAAVERLRAAVERDERICVHGDYDVDGICATALAVLTCGSSAPTSAGTCRAGSRRATASPATTIARLAEEGVRLILTVDCGITAVAEVEEAGGSAST